MFLVTTKCSTHTTCVVCINIVSKYLAVVNFCQNNAKKRIFMSMQGYEHLCLHMEGFFYIYNKPHITPGLYAIAFLIAISGAPQFPTDNKCCYLRM